MANIKTAIHSYYFDIRNPSEEAQYRALKDQLEAQGLQCFETWGGNSHYNAAFKNGLEIELETSSLFDNQWNTAPIDGVTEKGLRVFDWAQDYPANISRHIKRGHYLTQTAEMRDIRNNTMKCGYCGKQEPAAKGYTFCPHCIGSEYLKPSDLKLTRMRPVSQSKADFPELTEAERAHLMPIYKEAQLYGNTERDKKRIAETRARIEKNYRNTIHKAETEYKGFTWLMDHGIKPSLAIYYSHTNRFCFGWQNALDADTVSGLLDCITEFPFAYDIKCADGRTLSGK